MSTRFWLSPLGVLLLFAISAAGQTATTAATAPRDAAALAVAGQSLQALTGGTAVNDLTLQGSATYTAGSDEEVGAVTLLASGNLASRVSLSLTDGPRTEIRNGPAGNWIGADGVEHAMAVHNCWPDADWFYPGLSFQALSTDPNLGLAYVGLESKNGFSVQHLQLFRVLSGGSASATATIETLSTEDIYLDASSILPLFLDYSTHPDNDFNRSIPVEIVFSAYQKQNGILVPARIQKFFNGSLLLDLTIASAAVNSGLPASDFAVTGGVQ
jgi:hypothetical protein